MATVAMCMAGCGECGREFPYPSLSDFAYGDFILHSDDGQTFQFLHATNNAVWNFAAKNVLATKDVPAQVCASILQEVVARLADCIEGHSFTMRMVCPYCGSNHLSRWGGERISLADIPEARFQAFASLGESAKQSLLHDLQQQIIAEQNAAADLVCGGIFTLPLERLFPSLLPFPTRRQSLVVGNNPAMSTSGCYKTCLPDIEAALPWLAEIIGAKYEQGTFTRIEEAFHASGKTLEEWGMTGNCGVSAIVTLEQFEGYLFIRIDGEGPAFQKAKQHLWDCYIAQGGNPEAQDKP